jgi:hypothetical protein
MRNDDPTITYEEYSNNEATVKLLGDIAKFFETRMTEEQFNKRIAAFVDQLGNHPPVITKQALGILINTRTFPVYPTYAEISAAILDAHRQLWLPLSAAAKRLSDYSKTHREEKLATATRFTKDPGI